MLLRSPQKLGRYARCVTEWLVQWSDRAPERVFLAERNGAGGGRPDVPRSLRRGAPDRPGAARPRPRAGAPGRDPLRQRHRPRPARARRDARRRAGGADLARLLADVEGLRQAEGIFELLRPGLVFAADPQKFAPGARGGRREVRRSVAELLETNPGSTLETGVRKGQARDRREDPVHLRLDRDAEGRDQHARACCARTSRCSRRSGRSSRTGRRWSSTGCRGTTPSAATTTSTWCCATAARSTSTAASRCRA